MSKAEATGLSFAFESRPGALWVCWAHDFSEDLRSRVYIERFNTQALLTIIRHWAGEQWFPTDLWLRTHPIPEDDELRAVNRVRYQAAWSTRHRGAWCPTTTSISTISTSSRQYHE